jgi:hypothetical protein
MRVLAARCQKNASTGEEASIACLVKPRLVQLLAPPFLIVIDSEGKIAGDVSALSRPSRRAGLEGGVW